MLEVYMAEQLALPAWDVINLIVNSANMGITQPMLEETLLVVQ
jgi:hypothetical protein